MPALPPAVRVALPERNPAARAGHLERRLAERPEYRRVGNPEHRRAGRPEHLRAGRPARPRLAFY